MDTLIDKYLNRISKNRFNRHYLKYNIRNDRKEGEQYIYWSIDSKIKTMPHIECKFDKMSGIYSTEIRLDSLFYENFIENYSLINDNCIVDIFENDGIVVYNISSLFPKFICMAAFGANLRKLESLM